MYQSPEGFSWLNWNVFQTLTYSVSCFPHTWSIPRGLNHLYCCFRGPQCMNGTGSALFVTPSRIIQSHKCDVTIDQVWRRAVMLMCFVLETSSCWSEVGRTCWKGKYSLKFNPTPPCFTFQMRMTLTDISGFFHACYNFSILQLLPFCFSHHVFGFKQQYACDINIGKLLHHQQFQLKA